MRLARVFPRRTKATPDDDLVFVRPPQLFDVADAVHVSVAFTSDIPAAERLAEQWKWVAPVKVGGPAYEKSGQLYPIDFVPGRFIKYGYTFTSRGCPRHCWFCPVWRRIPQATPISNFADGWNILDDNLLACPRDHVEAVFAMLRRQNRRVSFTGGLEALALQDYQVELLAGLTPKPNCFFAFDPQDEFETLESAARRLIAAGFTAASHRLRCYVLIGFPKDTLAAAEQRLKAIKDVGFTPMAMLWRPETPAEQKYARSDDWERLKRVWIRPAIIHAGGGIAA